MLRINEKIPSLELESYHNDEIKKVKLAELKSKWSVFVFYPADFTFICPTELEELADLYEEFKKEGSEVYTVSTDTVFVHKAWFGQKYTICRPGCCWILVCRWQYYGGLSGSN